MRRQKIQRRKRRKGRYEDRLAVSADWDGDHGGDDVFDQSDSHGSFSQKITNRFVRSFLSYVPYAVLSAMTFPAIFYSTGSVASAAAGCAAALALAYWNKGLLTVALGAAAAVLLAQLGGV